MTPVVPLFEDWRYRKRIKSELIDSWLYETSLDLTPDGHYFNLELSDLAQLTPLVQSNDNRYNQQQIKQALSNQILAIQPPENLKFGFNYNKPKEVSKDALSDNNRQLILDLFNQHNILDYADKIDWWSKLESILKQYEQPIIEDIKNAIHVSIQKSYGLVLTRSIRGQTWRAFIADFNISSWQSTGSNSFTFQVPLYMLKYMAEHIIESLYGDKSPVKKPVELDGDGQTIFNRFLELAGQYDFLNLVIDTQEVYLAADGYRAFNYHLKTELEALNNPTSF